MYFFTNHFKKQSIKTQILSIILPIIICSYTILLAMFYFIYVDASRSNIIEQHERNTKTIARNVNSYFTNLNSNIDLLLYGTEIQNLISSYSKHKITSEELQVECNTLFSTYLLSAQAGVQCVYIIPTDSDIISSQTIYNVTPQQLNQKILQLSKYLEQSSGKLCFYYSDETSYVLTAAKNIFSIDDPNKKIGILLTEINTSFIDNMLLQIPDSEYNYFSLLLDKQLVYTTAPFSDDKTTCMNMKYHSQMNNSNFYAVRYSVNNFLQIGGLLNTSSAFASINFLWKQLLIISVIFLIVLIFLITRMSKTISIEFCTFISKLQNTSVVDETALIHTAASNEFAELTSEYNRMLQRLQESNKKLTTQQILLKNAEIKTLQAQINPHFLYNTLDCISSLASLNKTKEITNIVPKLANIMRMSIKGPDLLSISEDLKYVREYLDIQKMRFQDRLLFLIETEPTLHELYIPKLIIQPIVENAIIHGISKSPEKGFLSIQLSSFENDILIKVYNTGSIFPEYVLNDINHAAHSTLSLQKNIGLMNIQLRLKSQFGNSYGLSLENMEDNTSVCVTIRIPQIHTMEMSTYENSNYR